MFLASCFLVLAFAYWYCALIAELVFTSPAERALAPAVRVGLAFLLSITYFSAAWQLMSIGQASILGGALLLAYAWSRAALGPLASRAGLRGFVASHAKSFAGCVACALLFFLPLLAANTYGPFTEGGGDVSIYADTSQYVVHHRLTTRGDDATTLDEVLANVRDAARLTFDRNERAKRAAQRLRDADRERLNPPSADFAVYRLLTARPMSSFLYAPYGQFFFLAGDDNYAVYYGVQALVYALILAAAWYALSGSPRPARIALAGLVGASHSLVSVLYNTYSAQSIAILAASLAVCCVASIRLFSRAGLRAYGFPALYLFVSYVHFLSIVVPLAALAGLPRVGPPRVPAEAPAPHAQWRRVLRWVLFGTLAALLGLLAISGASIAVWLVIDLTVGQLSGAQNAYFGAPLPWHSFQWLAFLFGFVSQQHLRPFAAEVGWVLWVVRAGICAGVAAFLIGAALMVSAWRRRAAHPAPAFQWVVYAGVLAIAALHIALVQKYVYTQAKGAQNVLFLVYVALVIPLAVGLALRRSDARVRALTTALAVALAIFCAALVIPRGVYALKIARGEDRAAIVGPSYFDAARAIHERDSEPFVLVEPRKSADLYVTIQPFSGGRMTTSRHLALTRLSLGGVDFAAESIDASALIAAADLPHLWLLAAGPPRGPLASTWRAQRIAELRAPALLLFADDYERDFGERPRSPRAGDIGMSSYVRNGSAMVFVPAGMAGTLEVTLAPRDPAMFARMAREIAASAARGEFGTDPRIEAEGGFIRLSSDLASDAQPRLARIARYAGEYWINARLAGREITGTPGFESRRP